MKHVRRFLIALIVALVVAVPLLYSSYRQTTMRNFHIVEEGVLYRSGQLSPSAFNHVLDRYGIKTVVTLRTVRTPGKPFPDEFEKRICEERGVRHARITPRVWNRDEDGNIPAEQSVKEFLAIMNDRSNYPVLVHCFAGIHRTGTMCSIYRMEADHWSAEQAIEEMHDCGFEANDEGTRYIERYLRSYRPQSMRGK